MLEIEEQQNKYALELRKLESEENAALRIEQANAEAKEKHEQELQNQLDEYLVDPFDDDFE